MPSWTIHLAIANKINQKLKLDNDLFYYGNLIPDVDKNSKINRYNAHYYDNNLSFPNCKKENMINISLFLNDYKKKIKNPLILGYYCHLLTDNYFNNEVYTKCWVQDNNCNIIGIKFKNGRIKYIDIEDKKRIKRKYKHKDFELYGKYLFNNNDIGLPNNKGYLECGLPDFLRESIQLMEVAWYKIDNGIKYLRWDCDYCNLQTDINNAEVNGMISSDQAWYLRDKYLRLQRV